MALQRDKEECTGTAATVGRRENVLSLQRDKENCTGTGTAATVRWRRMFLHYGEMEDTVMHCSDGEKELEGTVSAERWRRTFCFSCTEMKENV